MSFVDQLRRAAEPEWTRAVEHRFVSELFAGTIGDERLARYLVQDYQFCDPFVALLGQAVASAPSLPSRLMHARQLGNFASDENDYFQDAFDRLGVDDHDRRQPARDSVTDEFVQLLLRSRDGRSYPEILAVLLVAEWLYRDWAHADRPWPQRPEHRSWIEVHNNPQFNAWVDWLRAELDSHVPSDPDEQAVVREAFLAATRLELAFFDACYPGGESGSALGVQAGRGSVATG